MNHYSLSPGFIVLRQHLALHRLGYAVVLRFPFVVSAAGLAHVVHLSGMTELLVSHLQHLYDGKHLALLGLRDSVYGEQEVGEVSPLGTARYGVDIQRRKGLVTVLVLYSRVSHYHRPDVARTAPCLQLRQHQSHLLRLRGTAAALGCVLGICNPQLSVLPFRRICNPHQ